MSKYTEITLNSALMPLNQLTLIPSIYTCIALIDNVIYGYSHFRSQFKFTDMAITSYALPLLHRLPTSKLRKVIGSLIHIVSLEVKNSAPMPTFLKRCSAVIIVFQER